MEPSSNLTFVEGASLGLNLTQAPSDDEQGKRHGSNKQIVSEVIQIWKGNTSSREPMIFATKNVTDLWLLSEAIQEHTDYNNFHGELCIFTTDELNFVINASLLVSAPGKTIGQWLYDFTSSKDEVHVSSRQSNESY